jgi:hypothetical protein
VDLVSGGIYTIPKHRGVRFREGDRTTFKEVPVYDAMVPIAEREAIPAMADKHFVQLVGHRPETGSGTGRR